MTVTSSLKDRIENPELLAKVVPVEEAVKHVTDGCTLAISGFTKSGEPKTFLPALAWHFSQTAPQARITLQPSDVVRLELPGGGGYGSPD